MMRSVRRRKYNKQERKSTNRSRYQRCGKSMSQIQKRARSGLTIGGPARGCVAGCLGAAARVEGMRNVYAADVGGRW